VRELAYDFRDWQSIEATGRGGAAMMALIFELLNV
jgi:hypothetical protein